MKDIFNREFPNDNTWTLWTLSQLPQKLLVNNLIQDQTTSSPVMFFCITFMMDQLYSNGVFAQVQYQVLRKALRRPQCRWKCVLLSTYHCTINPSTIWYWKISYRCWTGPVLLHWIEYYSAIKHFVINTSPNTLELLLPFNVPLHILFYQDFYNAYNVSMNE